MRSQQTRQIKADDIRKLVHGGTLAVPAFDEVLEAKTRYRRGLLSLF
ncbi:hypothetical protein ACOTDL_04910 [Achromobacter xylosoxidans]